MMTVQIAKWLARLVRTQFRSGFANRTEHARAWVRFWRSYGRYSRLRKQNGENHVLHLVPYVGEDGPTTEMDPIYFYQDCWAFEKIVDARPSSHVDVGSHHKFVALLSKVVPVTMMDIRPLPLPLDSLRFQEGSILDMPFETGSLSSVSSLCVIEHIGLGRYGDPLDVHGTERALAELKRVIQPGGDLYVSVPISDVNATLFNANRLFDEDYLRTLFDPFEVVESRYIYGNQFGNVWQKAVGVGCYHLRALQ